MRKHGSDNRVWGELITANDMNEPSDYEFMFDAHKPFPMIEFELETTGDAEPRVSQISIAYCLYEEDPNCADPISLIRTNFEIGMSDNIREMPKQHFDVDRALSRARLYYEPQAEHWYTSIYENGTFSKWAENVWNAYCIFTGTSTIKRADFMHWVRGFTALASDLIDFPIETEQQWNKRSEFLRIMAQNPPGTEFERFLNANWVPLLRKRDWTAGEAHLARLKDAIRTIEEFRIVVRRGQPLENFLHQIVDAFVLSLCSSKHVKKCEFCSGYFLYDKRKLYCSLLSDGRECGKSARNRRNYRNRSDEQRERNRQGNRELRLLYKRHGIKKKKPY